LTGKAQGQPGPVRFSALGMDAPASTPRAYLIRARPVPSPRPKTHDAAPHQLAFGTQGRTQSPPRPASGAMSCFRSGSFARRAVPRKGSVTVRDQPVADTGITAFPAPKGGSVQDHRTVTENSTSPETRQHVGSVVNGAPSCQSCGFCIQWQYLPMDRSRAGNARFATRWSRYMSIYFIN
jgi:hypothetical protein